MSEEYRGQRIVIRFDGQKCIHSRRLIGSAKPDAMSACAWLGWIPL